MQVCAARGATPIFVMIPQATNLKHRSEPHSPTTSGKKSLLEMLVGGSSNFSLIHLDFLKEHDQRYGEK